MIFLFAIVEPVCIIVILQRVLFSVKAINERVTVGNGKSMTATKLVCDVP
jgi:hypothetical protein